MKKRIFLLMILLIIILPLVIAAENDTDQEKIDLAYDCIAKQTSDCSDLSYEDQTFILLAVKKCKNELLENSLNGECWPKSGCKIKSTAQAILALDKAGAQFTKAETWLLSQNKTPTDVSWYLQIESPEATICSITYGSSSHTISIGENKKISAGAGCLSLAQDGYWLEIVSSCYDEEFSISCDKQFITNLLFKKKVSSKIYVSGETNSASADGTTREKIDSSCFMQSGSCDYEGSLWATLVLDYLDYDVSSYMPYLLTMAESNTKYLPDAFLYSLTHDSDYRISLLEQQKINYWDESGDKYYDTALALLPFQYEEISEKESSKEWLLEVQDKTGCWKGNLRNTAFLLYSVFSENSQIQPSQDDCEIDANGYCISSISCKEAEGEELTSYSSSCSGLNICCDRDKSLETCEEMNGKECSLEEECSVSTIEASDIYNCCTGYCAEPIQQSDCEYGGGICRSTCYDDEEELSDSCNYDGVCCGKKTEPEPTRLWIWVLIILIALIIIAIIFRDKLRPYWFRIKYFGKSHPKPRPGSEFQMPPRYPPRGFQRRILPPTQRPQMRRPPPVRPSGELDEVLKKLKDMEK
ncbi:MAG: hypothetical protein ABH811_00050 [archaeon]